MAGRTLGVYLRYNAVWNNVSPDVLQGEKVEWLRGVGDDSGGLRPARITMRLKDLALAAPAYDPDHPASPLYGIAGRNTRLFSALAIVTEGFETGPPYGVAFVNGGALPWAPTTGDFHSGTRSLKSGAITHSQTSDFDVTVPAGATALMFFYKIDAANGDGLQVITDPGPNQAMYVNQSSTVGTWVQLAITVVPGGVVRFRYTKDAAGSSGADAAWIDDLTFFDALGIHEIATWQPDQDEVFRPTSPGPGKGMRWTDLEAEGVLRRIGRWTDVLHSPMYLLTSSYGANLTGYWPGEAAGGVSSAVAGVLPAVVKGSVSYRNEDSPAGSDPILKMGSDGSIVGRFRKASGTAGWQLVWDAHLDAIPAAPGQLMSWTTSNGQIWYFDVTATSYNIRAVNAEGALVFSDAILTGGANVWEQHVVFRIRCTVAAGIVSVAYSWYGQDDSVIWGASTTYAGTLGYLTTWRVIGNPVTDGMAFGQVYATEGVAVDPFSGSATAAINGYAGERVADRFTRLCGQKGIFGSVVGDASKTLPMGPQKSDTFQGLLEEMAATEGGLIVDTRTLIGLTLRTRESMYSQTPKLTLTRAQCVAPLRKNTDDKGSWNAVTAVSLDGRTDVAALTAGPMSSADPPAGIGLYEKKVEGNWSAAQRLSDVAGWSLSKGTVPDARYTEVTLDLDGAAAGLELAAATVDPGDCIVLSDVTPDGVSLLVLGIKGWLDTKFRRKITFTCVPATIEQASNFYNAATARYDSKTTTMAASAAPAVTALAVTSTDVRDAWVDPAATDPRTGAAYGGYDLNIAGERVTVTAAGAPAGTGPITQTLTVTRAVNGVSKTLPAAAVVQLHTPVRWAL